MKIYDETKTYEISDADPNRGYLIQDKLVKTEMEYREKENSKMYTREELSKYKYEVIKQRNLYEYGMDIIRNTEQMSFNKNILTKQYYIVIPYYSEDTENQNLDKEEIKNNAFTELYTKAQSIISALFVCEVKGKILDSNELMELLYIAYNRDESEVYNLERLLNSGYEDLYSTAPDVLDKRMRALDKKIEEDAIRKANEVVYEVAEENEKQRAIKEKEDKINELIDNMAKLIIQENEELIGQEVSEKAQEKIDNEKNKDKKGGKTDDVKKTKAKTTGRTRKTA